MNAVAAKDPNVRIVYKEFAILGPTSLVAARAALAAKRQGKYGEFHHALMSAEQADADSVTATAKALGLDYEKLVRDRARDQWHTRFRDWRPAGAGCHRRKRDDGNHCRRVRENEGRAERQPAVTENVRRCGSSIRAPSHTSERRRLTGPAFIHGHFRSGRRHRNIFCKTGRTGRNSR